MRLSRGVYCVMGPALRPTSQNHHHLFSHGNYSLRPKPFISNIDRTRTSPLQITTTHKMSSDDAYLSFLEKANSDLSAGQQPQAQTQTDTQRAETQTVDVNAQIPASLQSIDAFYVSETDEPFEAVVLGFEGATRGEWPGSSQLSSLISSDTDVSNNITTLSPASFDPRNQYPGVLKAVRAAAVNPGAKEEDVEVRIYRVDVGPSRVDYFVLGLDTERGRVVGFRARAVET